MASAQWHKRNSFVAFPIDVLFSPTGIFVGFVMKKVGGSKPVHMLYSPASRKIEFGSGELAAMAQLVPISQIRIRDRFSADNTKGVMSSSRAMT
jgi:hypothetical protein